MYGGSVNGVRRLAYRLSHRRVGVNGFDQLLHRAAPDGSLSFVRLDLEPPAGILPEATGGGLDVWIARAVAPGDVLRDVPAVLAALEEGPERAALPLSIASREGHGSALPVRASVASTASTPAPPR